MKRAKVVHDNLNAGGGSERLAFATIELLNGFIFQIIKFSNSQNVIRQSVYEFYNYKFIIIDIFLFNEEY